MFSLVRADWLIVMSKFALRFLGDRTMRRLLVATLIMLCAGLVARAADCDPTGTWTWTTPREQIKIKLRLQGDKVAGAMIRKNGQELKVENGTFKDGDVAFEVLAKTPGGQPMLHKYQGKVTGDAIKGKVRIEFPDHTVAGDWKATRFKD
jgi:hypothetical protein